MAMSAHPFETGLDRNSANYVPLTPVSFLTRAASAFANKTAVIDGESAHVLDYGLGNAMARNQGFYADGSERARRYLRLERMVKIQGREGRLV